MNISTLDNQICNIPKIYKEKHSPKMEVDMTLLKRLTWNYSCNGFWTISPPKTAINGSNMKITEKPLEKAVQNCLKIISTSKKMKKDITFSKTGTKINRKSFQKLSYEF